MKNLAAGNTFVIVAITLTWLITIPLELLFWVNVVGWSLELTLLITLPIMGVLIPISYPIAVLGNERFRRGEDFLTADVLWRSGWLGVWGALLSACAVWLYMLFLDAQYWGLLIVVLPAISLIGVVIHYVRKLIRQIGREINTTEDADEKKLST